MKKDTKLILIVLAGILAIVLLCIFAVQGTQNKAFTLEEQVNTAQSTVFWIFWIIGTGVIVFKFYERENEWLE